MPYHFALFLAAKEHVLVASKPTRFDAITLTQGVSKSCL
jgi:hypothetical protein